MLLLLTLALGLAGVVLAAVASGERAVDFTAAWRLQPDEALLVDISEEEHGVFTVVFAPPDAAWRREAVLRQVDRFQLAGRLGDVEGVPARDERLTILSTATGASVSVLSVSADSVDIGVRESGAAGWTDLGTFERGTIWSDPSRAVGRVLLVVLVAMVVALAVQIPLERAPGARRKSRDVRTVRRVVSVLSAVVFVAALLIGSPILALVAALILFATWLLTLVRWLPDEVTGTGAMLDYLLSPRRRDGYRDEEAAKDAQAQRGVALERAMVDVRNEWSGTARTGESEGDSE